MGWRSDDGKHMGWAAAEFPGDRFAYSASGPPGKAGALVRRRAPDTGRWADYDPDGPEVVDGRTALGWRGICECGWLGPLWIRTAGNELADPDARRLNLPEPSPHGDPPAEIEDAIQPEWLGHLQSS